MSERTVVSGLGFGAEAFSPCAGPRCHIIAGSDITGFGRRGSVLRLQRQTSYWRARTGSACLTDAGTGAMVGEPVWPLARRRRPKHIAGCLAAVAFTRAEKPFVAAFGQPVALTYSGESIVVIFELIHGSGKSRSKAHWKHPDRQNSCHGQSFPVRARRQTI